MIFNVAIWFYFWQSADSDKTIEIRVEEDFVGLPFQMMTVLFDM